MNFADQYKHPRWQEKRIEVLNESRGVDGQISCVRCGNTESQMHVHHKRYVKGRMIWEYSAVELEALCENCHRDAHIEKEQFQELMARFDSHSIVEIQNLIVGYAHKSKPISVDEYLDATCDPFTLIVGEIAGVLANRLTIGDLQNLQTQLRNTRSGEVCTFFISKKPRGFEGFE